MPKSPLHLIRNPDRVNALRRSRLLDSPREEAYDALTQLAVDKLNVPVALISLVDLDRQFFKSEIGLPEPWATQRSTPLSHSFCQHALGSTELLVIEDADSHELVRDNLAINTFDLHSYLGAPLVTWDGHVLGTFSVGDHHPRVWTDEEMAEVQNLAALTTVMIESATAQAADG